jgi:hypothetical protein
MNSGIQDSCNLAWKLALVCQDQATPSLLDSYEAERRPVAAMITASGEAFEDAQHITDPAERRARDEQLRATFADPAGRHHESIAEAELDIDYCSSPIVMGDGQDVLSPGHRIPDTLEIRHPNGQTQLLHQLAHRAGHTALLLGGPAADQEAMRRLPNEIRNLNRVAIVEEIFAFSTRPSSEHQHGELPRASADSLGINELTLLAVRPDGHVGLRADNDHIAALAAYGNRLTIR